MARGATVAHVDGSLSWFTERHLDRRVANRLGRPMELPYGLTVGNFSRNPWRRSYQMATTHIRDPQVPCILPFM